MNITYFKVDYFLVQDFSCVMMHDENTCKLTGEAVCGWCFEWHSKALGQRILVLSAMFGC